MKRTQASHLAGVVNEMKGDKVQALRWSAVSYAALVWLVSACAGDAASSQSADRSPDESNPANHPCMLGDCEATGGRATATRSPVCPSEEPEVAQPCEEEGITCTYGESVTAFCRRYYECANLSWQLQEGRTAGCAFQPETFCSAEPAPGSECTVGQVSVFVPCEYSAGVACYCIGNPVGVPGAPGEWECYGPPRNASCPELLPNLGEGCAASGQFCRYGIVTQACYAPYAQVYCYQGAWEAMGAGCFE